MKEPLYILKAGTKIKTHAMLGSTEGMFVPLSLLNNRKGDEEGVIQGPVPGHGGDVYLVKHSHGDAAYCFTEFELVEADISGFVSNETNPVFAIGNLPEEVIAVLFAQYSRAPGDLRTRLRALLAEEGEIVPQGPPRSFAVASEKARAFHEKWVVGYGHASVAEHAIIHLGIEGVSILAAKAIEDARLASFTEKSTRYVAFDRDSFVTPPELVGSPHEPLYRKMCVRLFHAYLELIPQVMAETRKQVGPDVAEHVVRAHALDTLRGLLPASTQTNLGLTANARTVASLVTKLRSSELGEMREVGDAIRVEAETVCPTLLRHADPSPMRAELRKAVLEVMPEAQGDPHAARHGVNHVSVRFHEFPMLRLLNAFSLGADIDTSQDPGDVATLVYDRTSTKEMSALLATLLEKRGSHEAVPRAFEAVTLDVHAVIDYGAYRDLQRHRICSPFPGILSPCLDFSLPTTLPDQHADLYVGLMRDAWNAWKVIHEAHGPLVAQYVVPLAFKVRVSWTMNLREAIHLIELRSAKQGHPSYRRFAQELFAAVVENRPWLEGLIRVDRNDYPLAR